MKASLLYLGLAAGLMFTHVWDVSAQSFTFSTLAGFPGQGNANGTGTNAFFNAPNAVAADGGGNLYVADTFNHTIRKIDTNGVVTTIAGYAGVAGSNNGTGTNALFNQPGGIAVDAAGNLYVADSGNQTIRKITSTGSVSTFAGTVGVAGGSSGIVGIGKFRAPQGLAYDASSSTLYVADYGNHAIRSVNSSGSISTLAGTTGVPGTNDGAGTSALFNQPAAVAVDASHNLYVADMGNGTIRKIVSGAVTTYAGFAGTLGTNNGTGTNASFYQPSGVTVDAAGNVYVADYFNNALRKIAPGAVVTTLAGTLGTYGNADGATNNARFWGPSGLTLDASNNVYVADAFNSAIRKVTSAGIVTTVAGTSSIGTANGTGASARFNLPLGGVVDNSGNLFVVDSANHAIRKVTRAGVVTTFAGSPGVAGSANGTGTNATFNRPAAIAIDSANNLYVADTFNNLIRKITTGGVVTTLAGSNGVTGNVDATGTAALFNLPSGIAVDSANNVYVADTFNHVIRKITSAGVVTTFAGSYLGLGSADGTNATVRFNLPKGIVADAAGNIFVADYGNHTIRALSPLGVSMTLAGTAGLTGSADGTNGAASFLGPQALGVDIKDGLYVVDSGNQTLRKITPSGTNWIVTTIAGQPGVSGSVDGTGASVEFSNPAGIAIDNTGYVFISDTANNTIRVDTSAPLPLEIVNPTVVTRPTSAFVNWTTYPVATAQVAYGTTTNYGTLTSLNTNLVSSQSVLLVGLQPDTTYYYQVYSTSQDGDTATTNGSFYTDQTIIMDSTQPLYTGLWINDSSGPDRYSAIYKYASVATNSDTAQALFRPAIVTPANYDVAFWYSEGSNRSSLAPIVVSYSGNATSLLENETVPGGFWKPIVTNVPFALGTNGFVRLGNATGESNKIVIADAIRLTYTSGQDIPVNGILPSWYSAYYFGTNVVSSANLAANGYSILKDYLLGLSPTDPSAQLLFNLIPVTNGVQAVFYPALGGRQYQLQATTNLLQPNWTNVTNLTLTQTNNYGAFLNTNISSQAVYYRLSVTLLP